MKIGCTAGNGLPSPLLHEDATAAGLTFHTAVTFKIVTDQLDMFLLPTLAPNKKVTLIRHCKIPTVAGRKVRLLNLGKSIPIFSYDTPFNLALNPFLSPPNYSQPPPTPFPCIISANINQ